MASVKKTMKTSKTKQANKTKQAKQPGTPKAKAAKKSAALKAKQAAAARMLASKKLAASKSARKTGTKTAAAAARGNRQVAAKPAARKKASTARAAKTSVTRRAKPVLARATAAKRGAASRAKLVRGKTARRASANKPARRKQAAAPKKTPAIGASRRVAAKPAAAVRKAADSAKLAAQKSAASKAAAAAILALKRNAAGLSHVRKQAASQLAGRLAGNSSSLDLESKERRAVIKKSEKEISAGSVFGPADANVAGAAGGASQSAARGAGKPLAAKTLGSKPLPSSTSRPGAAGERPLAALDGVQTNMAEAKPVQESAPPAHKPAKIASPQRQVFKPHEFVVYPAHGVGQIITIEEQEVAGFKLELFVISFIKDKMILKVPTLKAASVRMRKLSDAPALKAALDTLAGRARVKRTMWSRRAQEYEAKINSGDLNAIAEVVRDLYRSDTQPEQSYSERQLYEAALERMAREIVVVQNLTETESLKVIEAQLQKGPRRGKTEEGEAEEAAIGEAA